MIRSEKTNRFAVSIDSSGEVTKLSRIPFMSGSFNELWLQNLIAENPDILPTGEISPQYENLICIGREVPVGYGETSGYIDNLYVSSSGAVVIVETKLFRNQESRRTVVAQIIDYAKELSKWDAEKLNSVSSDYYYRTEGQAYNIIDIMARKGYLTISDEAMLTDRLNVSLQTSSFLLLIVGDGIRTGVQQLADFLNDNTSMSFNLALAEMEVYQNGCEIIAIPNILTKTQVIERTVSDSSFYEESEKKPGYIQKPILSRMEFISRFSDNGGYEPDDVFEFIGDMEAIDGLSVSIAPTELTIRFSPEDGYSYALLTLSIASNHSDIWIMPGRIKSALLKHGRFPFDAEPFLDFFKQFINVKRCKTAPYENEAGFYYANVGDVLQNKNKIISEAEKFSSSVTSNER